MQKSEAESYTDSRGMALLLGCGMSLILVRGITLILSPGMSLILVPNLTLNTAGNDFVSSWTQL